jgi:Sulfotransferase domain
VSVELPAALPGGPRSLRTCFLVGAPRCGTTFLAKALACHADVCFSKPKETHFFARDAATIPPERWAREFLGRYFGALETRHRLIAEGSPLQLRDPEAIERLLRFDPEARFVVAIRNPIEMIQSFHARLVYLLDEDERDFEQAWTLQAKRAQGERIPGRCRDPRSLQYREMASLGTQLERLLKQVGRERVHVVVYDDIATDPAKVYRELLAFLGLPGDGRTRFRRKNGNREFRHAWVQAWAMNPPHWVMGWLDRRQQTGRSRPHWVRNIRRRIKRWNTRRTKRAPLTPAMRARLHQELALEVECLTNLLGRDLTERL